MLHLAEAGSVVALLPAVIAVILALAALAGGVASLAHARNNDRLSDELTVTREALAVAGQVGQAIEGGKSPLEAIQAAQASDEAKDLLHRFKVFAHLAALVLAFSFLAGCVSPVTPERVGRLRRALEDERQAVVALPGHEDEVARARVTIDEDLAGSPLTPAKVEGLRGALSRERSGVVARAGFEDAVAKLRSAEDRDVAAIGSAVQ